jgi:hypothetical protein
MPQMVISHLRLRLVADGYHANHAVSGRRGAHDGGSHDGGADDGGMDAMDAMDAMDGRGEKCFAPTIGPSVGVAPFHPVDMVDAGNTVNPIGADGDDTNDIGGAAPVGDGI